MGYWGQTSTALGILLCSPLLVAFVSGEQILIKGGIVVNADQEFKSDVLIVDELIQKVEPSIEDDSKMIEGRFQASGRFGKAPPGARVIETEGKYVMPGGIDPHTHCEMPFMGEVACDDFFSCQAAALAGGTTFHVDFALPTNGDLAQGFQDYKAKAEKSCMDYGFHMAVTKWDDKVAQDMERLVSQGVNSFKFFMAYKGALMVSDEQLLQGMRRCRALGALVQVHAENGDAVEMGQQRMAELGVLGPEGHALSRPAVLEGEATARAIRLARFVDAPLYVVHVMSSDALDEVAAARKLGQAVVGEPVVSGLALEESALWHPNFTVAAQYVMSPPIRSQQHRAALKAALAGGVLSIVATDHAVFNSTQKALGRHDFRKIPNGVNGIEERMHVVWDEMVASGLMSPSDFVRVTSTAAAQVFNLYPRKGVLAPGSDADLIVLDPHSRHTLSASHHHSRMDTNVYEARSVLGQVTLTISRGRVVWQHGRLNITSGTGRFVPMAPFGPLFRARAAGDPSADPLLHQRYGPVPVDRSRPHATRDRDEL